MTSGRNPNLIGWAFVAVQAVLLAALVLLPGRNDWPTPGWFSSLGQFLIIGGLVIVVISALGLGAALTPTPVPTRRGQLKTTGLYGQVRHPIYTGVLAVVVGITIRSGSLISLAVALVTIVFFDRKARWEEARLREKYPGYEDYAAITPRFVPQPWRTSRPVR